MQRLTSLRNRSLLALPRLAEPLRPRRLRSYCKTCTRAPCTSHMVRRSRLVLHGPQPLRDGCLLRHQPHAEGLLVQAQAEWQLHPHVQHRYAQLHCDARRRRSVLQGREGEQDGNEDPHGGEDKPRGGGNLQGERSAARQCGGGGKEARDYT